VNPDERDLLFKTARNGVSTGRPHGLRAGTRLGAFYESRRFSAAARFIGARRRLAGKRIPASSVTSRGIVLFSRDVSEIYRLYGGLLCRAVSILCNRRLLFNFLKM
jgi:hypothetical protein